MTRPYAATNRAIKGWACPSCQASILSEHVLQFLVDGRFRPACPLGDCTELLTEVLGKPKKKRRRTDCWQRSTDLKGAQRRTKRPRWGGPS